MKKVYRIYCKAETLIAAAAFFAIIVLTFINAVLRIFKRPIVWNDDVALLLFSWCAFLGADIAMRSNRLVGMDLLTTKFPPKVQKILQLIVYLFMLAVLGLFAVKGYDLAVMNWKRFMNSLKLSYGWATLSLPVCSVLMMLTIVIKIAVLLKNFSDDNFRIKMHDPDNEGKEKEVEA